MNMKLDELRQLSIVPLSECQRLQRHEPRYIAEAFKSQRQFNWYVERLPKTGWAMGKRPSKGYHHELLLERPEYPSPPLGDEQKSNLPWESKKREDRL